MHTWTVEGRNIPFTPAPRTYREAYDILVSHLAVSGPRSLTATRDDGATVTASLYDGEDHARDPQGRYVTYLL